MPGPRKIAGELRVGIVGFGWMGQLHARSLARLTVHYPDLALRPAVIAVCDSDEERRTLATDVYGVQNTMADWQDLLDRPDVDAICVTGPNFVHHEVACAAAAAGKHLWVEKPAGRRLAESQDIRDVVRAAGVHCTVGFQYRNVPAVELLRSMVAQGALGDVQHVDVRFLTDYAADPNGAHSWRFVAAQAGSGVLGDLVCHATDLMSYVVGTPTSLVADQATFIAERPVPQVQTSHFAKAHGGPKASVENEDYVSVLFRFTDGARGAVQASRVAVGLQNSYSIDVHGTDGRAYWNFQAMGLLRVTEGARHQDAPMRELHVGPETGDFGRFQPAAAIAMGYDDLKVIEAAAFVRSVATGTAHGATIDDAVASAAIADAVATSCESGRWVDLMTCDR